MNQVTPEQKDSVTKTLAIVGFVVAILFAVWLAVQVVSIIPTAFNSLASIADGVYNYNENTVLTVTTKNNVVNTGEAFTLSWTQMRIPGTYTFSYVCAEGTSVEVRDSQTGIMSLDCDTEFNLEDTTTADIVVDSEKQRFIDVTYTVAFTPTNTNAERIATNGQVTIVNATIPAGIMVAAETPTEGVVAGESTTDQNEASTTVDTGLTAGEPTVTEEIIYALPVSDPNGTVDLEITYLAVGSLTGTTFRREANINIDEQGAFQFAVQNMGTKTSDAWTFDADLPSGIEYTSGPQVVLKPNEKAIITIGFEGLTQVGVERFGAVIDVDDDTNKNNNSFTWAVEVVN
jgi:hypothetical protein